MVVKRTMTNIIATIQVILGVFLMTKTSVSTSGTSSVNIFLADQNSQFVGKFQRSAINVTYNISETTNDSQSLLALFKICANAGQPLLFMKNDTVIGCGTLNTNNLPSNATQNLTNKVKNCSSNPCQGNDTSGDTSNVNSTNLATNATVKNGTNMTMNCSSSPCLVNTTTSVNSTSLLSNATVNGTNMTRNCSSSPCPVNTTTSVNSTSLLSNTTVNGTNMTMNCSSSPCPVNTTSINSTSLLSNATVNGTNMTMNCSSSPCLVNTTSINSTSLLSNATVNGTNMTMNCSSSPCPVNTTSINSTSLLSNATVNGTNMTMNCSSSPCLVNTTSINSTSLLSNATVNGTNMTINCSSSPCAVNSTSINSTSLSSNATVNGTNVTRNCSSSPCQEVNVTNTNLTTSDLILAYKTEFFTLVSLPVLTNANFTVLFAKIDTRSIQCSFDPGDETPLAYGNLSETSVHFPHVYLSYGVFTARVQSITNASTLLDASRQVLVKLPLVVQGLRCADVVATNETVSWILNVIQAMQLHITVIVGDSERISYNLSETPVGIIRSKNETLQELNCTCSNNTSDLSKVFTLPSLVFKRKFRLRAIELNSTISGPLHFQVFRAADQITEDLHEFSANLSCPPSLNQTTNMTVCFQTSYFGYHASPRMLSSTVVTAVHNLSLIVNAGYNFITLSDQDAFTANPGDVIGLNINQSAVFISSPLSATNLTANSSLLANTSSELSNSSFINATKSTVTSSDRYYLPFHGLSIYGILPYETRIFLRFMDPGEFSLRIHIRDVTENVINFRQMLTVQRPLENLELYYKHIVQFNSTHTLGFRVERAINSSCAWALTGPKGINLTGLVNGTLGTTANESMPGRVERLEFSFNYTHNVPGEFTFMVTCTNILSNVSEVVPISVRRNISGFNASLCFASFSYEHALTCWKATAFGDHIGYEWTIDNTVFKASTFKNVFQHATPRGREQFLNVSVRNAVSEKKLVLGLKILENPLSILVSPSSLTAPSLSVVTFVGLVSWRGYDNATEFYESYAVNISEGLSQFIRSPNYCVKIDDNVSATNVSNATLLKHIFPLAGSTARKHSVHFEATGHPEMNRQKEITIVDRIEGLRINSSDCPSEITINRTCVFMASCDQGSDVMCTWQVGSREFSSACRIEHEFRELGNVTVHVTGSNVISSSKAIFNITVIMPHETKSSVVTTSPNTSYPPRSPTTVLQPDTSSLITSSLHSTISTAGEEYSVYQSTSYPIESTFQQHRSPTTVLQPDTSSLITSSLHSTISTAGEEYSVYQSTSYPIESTFQQPRSPTTVLQPDTTSSLITSSLHSTISTAGEEHSVYQSTSYPIESTFQQHRSQTTVLQSDTSSLITSSLHSTISTVGEEYSVYQSSSAPSRSITVEPYLRNLVIHGPQFIEVGKEVTFNASFNASMGMVFIWSINNTAQYTTNSSMSTIFNHPGKFLISVNVSNGATHRRANILVFVQDLVSGLQIQLLQKSFSKNAVILFSVGAGTDVSFLAAFGDGSPRIPGKVRELTRNVTLLHEYEQPGEYYINITVFNNVSSTADSLLVFVRESCKLRKVRLYGVSQNLQISRKFTENDDVVIAVKTSMRCTSLTELRFRWRILRINSGISDKVPLNLGDTPVDESTLSFPAHQLSLGVYNVSVTVIAVIDDTSTSLWGLFRRTLANLIVLGFCGNHRTTPVDEPLMLNATVVDGFKNGRNLTYEWFCDKHGDVTCFRRGDEVILRNSSGARFPGNFLELGESYDFVIKVTDGTRHGMTSQRITFGESNVTLQLCLRCPQETKKVIARSQKAEIIASCLNCNMLSNLTWTWRLVKILQGKSQSVNASRHLTIDANKLTIPPYTLDSNSLYRAELNVTSHGKQGYATYELLTNDPPSGGFCSASPSQGVVLTTSFLLMCQAWYDTHRPLFFQYRYSIDGEDYSLFFHGKNPQALPTYFEAGLQHRNYTLNIKATITDSIGSSIVRFLIVKNLPLSEDKIQELLRYPRVINEQVESMLNSSNTQGAVQYMKIVSGLMNERSNDNQHRKQRIKIRQAFLRHVEQLCCRDRYSVEQTLQTMLSVSNVPSELNLKTQSYASRIYLKMSQKLSSVPTETAIENELNDARDLVKGISLVLKASSLLSNDVSQENNNKIRKIIDVCLRSISTLGDALLLRMKPGEPVVTIKTPEVIIALQKHYTSNFPGKRLVVPTQLNEFVIPKTMENITGDSVGTKLVSMLNNPFLIISTDSHTPTTAAVSFMLTDTQGQEVVMRNLLEPFSMFLYKPDSSSDLVKHNATLEEHSKPHLYQIKITATNPSLLVSLHTVTSGTKGQLRLRIKKHNRSAVLANDVIVSTESSFPVSRTWRNLNGDGKYDITVEYESFSRFLRTSDQVKYTISFVEIGCFYWNESKNEWESNGCQVGSLSTPVRTHCLCNHLTWFGGRLIVPPNSIDLTTIVQRINNPRNYATILALLSSLCFLYLIAVLWAKKRDKQDIDKNKITCCPTNHVMDSYQYQVIVYTGMRRNAGTTANVGLLLLGESGKSSKCLLKDSRKDVLKRGGVDPFLVTTTGSLGAFEYVHIWHDNAGSSPAWFVNRVVVLDMHTGQVCNFLCYRWLAVDEGDGQIQRLLPVADSEELVQFRHLFVSRVTAQLTDAHLWFSVACRPVFSPFTRVQRVSCCLSLLLTSMMVNAMWYQTGGTGVDVVDLGLFSFSWEEIFVGICSSLIIFPVNFLLVQIFRHCRSHLPASRTKKSHPILPWILPKKRFPSFFIIESQPKVTSATSLRDIPSRVTTFNRSDILPFASTSQNPTSQNPTSSKLDVTQHVISPSSGTPSSITQGNSKTNGATPDSDVHVLPYWFTYVAWLGVVVTCVTSATVTFLYGIEFGETKTKKWLLSLSVSIVNDIFVAQPLKVLAISIAFAYIVKKPLKEHYASNEATQHEVLESISQDDLELEVPDPSLCTAADFLKTAREKRAKDKFMYGLLKTICVYLVFIVLVLILAYSQRDPNAYYLTKVQEDTFTRPGLKKFSHESVPGFHQVGNVKQFWLWIEARFLPRLANVQWYNYSGEWLTYTENFGGFIFGGARWRQKRLKEGCCKVLSTFKNIIPSCTGNYDWSNEDNSNYNMTWKNPLVNGSCSDIPFNYWCFSSSASLKTFPYVGNLETYSGGGYKKDITQDYNMARNLTRNLKGNAWIDEYTRAVFIEFTLYNPNVNLFSVVTLLFEVSSSGNFNPKAEIHSIRLYSYVGNFEIFYVICQLFFLAFLSYFTYHSGKLLWKEKWSFFGKTWNIYEVCVVVLSWLAVVFYFISVALRGWTLREFRDEPGRFTSFVYSSKWQMTLEYTIAFLVSLITLKLLRLFQFNRRMFLLPLTLSNTVFELLNYSLVFFIVFVAFTLLYHLMLHPYSAKFASVIVTMETLVQVLLGKSDMLDQHYQYPVIERIVLFCYMCIMKFILLNVFVVIIIEGFRRAREQNDQQRNDFEFVDYVKQNVYEFLGIRRLVEKSETNSKKGGYHVRFQEDEVTSRNIEQVLDDMEQKVELLWKLVNSSCFEDDMWD